MKKPTNAACLAVLACLCLLSALLCAPQESPAAAKPEAPQSSAEPAISAPEAAPSEQESASAPPEPEPPDVAKEPEAEDSRETLTKSLYEGDRALTLQMYRVANGAGLLERIEVYEGSKKIQTLRELSFYYSDKCFVDLNFDGYPDLQVVERMPGLAGRLCKCYLWNPSRGRFEFNNDLSNLVELEADSTRKTLKSAIRWGQGYYITRELKWNNGVLETVSLGADINDMGRLGYSEFQNLWLHYRFEKHDDVFVELKTVEWIPEEAEKIRLEERNASPYAAPELSHPQIETLKLLAEYRDMYEEVQDYTDENRFKSQLYSLLLRIAYEQNDKFLQAGSGIGQVDLAALRANHRIPEQGTMDSVNSGRFARCADMEAVARWLFDGAFQLTLPESDVLKAEGYGDGVFYTNPIKPDALGRTNERYRIFRSIAETEDGVVLEALHCTLIDGKVLTDRERFFEGDGIGYVSDDGTPWFYDDFDAESLPRRRYTFYRASDGHYMAVSAE